MANLRFALVGCGRIAKKHAELLAGGHVAGAELASVCDVDQERADQFGKKYKVPSYADPHEMIEREDIDVLSILTPSGLHAQQVIELARYRKHFVVEKPMALTLSDADQMIQTCDSHGVRLFVVKQNRWNPPVLKLRQAIDEGRLGKAVLGSIRVRWCRRQDYYDMDSWRGTWRLDGGVIANQASHHIDLLEWMMGDVESVHARGSTQLVDIQAEDTVVATLKFESGALGIIEATTATRPTDLEGSLSVLGEKGSVEIAGFAVNEMRTWKFCDDLDDEQKVIEECRTNPPNVYGFGHLPYMNHVVDCIRNSRAAIVDGLVGRRSLELITAMYESIETGSDIRLRFKPKASRLGELSDR